jgi:type II secretory pathway pseudopilin PulG
VRADPGMSLVELTIAMGVMLVVMAGVVGIVAPAQTAAVAEPEAADMQQRLRVAADTLVTDMMASGAGPDAGRQPSALIAAFAPVLPFRRSHFAGALPGTFSPDTITLFSTPPHAAHSALASDLLPGATMVQVAPESGCTAGLIICRFTAGSTVLVYDGTGSFDVLSVATVDQISGLLQLDPRTIPTAIFKSGSTILDTRSRVYYVSRDALTNTSQLMQSDAAVGIAVPVVDHIVGLTFDYYGEPRAPALVKPIADPAGPWTTYGPKPPPIDAAETMYPAGENCTFQLDSTGTGYVPRLADFGSDPALAALTPGQLTDGPWCPDALDANRWDADLLRMRAIVVTVRVEAALAALRGPAGLLFANGGLSRTSSRWMPDIRRQFIVTPRNMSAAR